MQLNRWQNIWQAHDKREVQMANKHENGIIREMKIKPQDIPTCSLDRQKLRILAIPNISNNGKHHKFLYAAGFTIDTTLLENRVTLGKKTKDIHAV